MENSVLYFVLISSPLSVHIFNALKISFLIVFNHFISNYLFSSCNNARAIDICNEGCQYFRHRLQQLPNMWRPYDHPFGKCQQDCKQEYGRREDAGNALDPVTV